MHYSKIPSCWGHWSVWSLFQPFIYCSNWKQQSHNSFIGHTHWGSLSSNEQLKHAPNFIELDIKSTYWINLFCFTLQSLLLLCQYIVFQVFCCPKYLWFLAKTNVVSSAFGSCLDICADISNTKKQKNSLQAH